MKVKQILNVIQPKWIPNKSYNEFVPKITVVLPTFKRAKSGHLEKAIESVIDQKYRNWELIIVDDASTDGTRELIEFYMEIDSRVNCIRHNYNLGLPAVSEYEAYIKSRGEYIAYIFDDNEWEEDHLYLSMKAMKKHNVKATYGITRSFSDNSTYLDIGLIGLEYLPVLNCIGNGSIVLHKEIIETVGLYDPHLSLTRICDWDLWQRISKSYHILNIDNMVTNEFGPGLNDSLGNTIQMDTWVGLERMSMERNKMLLPSNFEEVDIIDKNINSTYLFDEFVDLLYRKYSNKKWFLIEEKRNIIKEARKKRVLLIASALDATVSIGFNNLKKNSIIKVALFNAVTEVDLSYTDVIIFIRDLPNALFLNKRFKRFAIPSYYYIDDNYAVILKDIKIDKDPTLYNSVFNQANKMTYENLIEFDKIIVSTINLKNYFIQNSLHNQVDVLSPCFEEKSIIDQFQLTSTDSNMLSFAFMGGEFRETIFLKKIYPALILMSHKLYIKLVCPETLREKIIHSFPENNKVSLVGVKRDCYEQTIVQYKKENIRFLIHCGEEILNNKYKTKNALINAVRLGAVLVTSQIEPYTNDQKTCVIIDNEISSWYDKLMSISLDNQLHEQYFSNAKNFVLKEFEKDEINNIFNQIIDVPLTDITTTLTRMKRIIEEGQYGLGKLDQISQTDLLFDIDHFLSFSKFNQRVVTYKVKIDCEYFQSIGFIFSSDDQCYDGELILNVFDDKGKLIGNQSKQMHQIEIREINYFKFNDVVRVTSPIILAFTINYNNNFKGSIGIYENRHKKTLIYKLIKKIFNIRLKTINLVYFSVK